MCMEFVAIVIVGRLLDIGSEGGELRSRLDANLPFGGAAGPPGQGHLYRDL
jgi:hypothetical protein